MLTKTDHISRAIDHELISKRYETMRNLDILKIADFYQNKKIYWL
jgi:hypothetical protein